MAGINWSTTLDIDQAATNVRTEFVGDWHRDPWGWPELGYVVAKDQETFIGGLNESGSRRAALIDVPKENWGSRPAVVLDVLDRLCYQALVDRLSLDLIGSLPSSVYGWRLPPGATRRGVYSHNNLQWERYRDHLSSATMSFDAALVTDIVSFFASIPLESVKDAVDDKAPKGRVAQRLLAFLEGFDKIPERSGLPQRSLASAVLANMLLAPLDDVLQHYSSKIPSLEILGISLPASPRRSWTRWMDDMWLFGEDESRMRRAQTDLQSVTRTLGLNINSAKTDVFTGEQVAEKALQIQHSAVDDALDHRDDATPLEELIDRLLDRPETASRTSLRFVTTRMREHDNRHRIQEFAQLAERMPHAADALAPLFKVVFTQSSLQDWFASYARGDWAAFQWSVAQFVRMFPSGTRPRKALRDFAAVAVGDAGTSLPLLAVACQRLAAWDPGEFRAVARAAIAKTSHPQNRRLLALAALEAGETRATVRRWLRQEDENAMTLGMLEYFNFTPPKVVADFAN